MSIIQRIINDWMSDKSSQWAIMRKVHNRSLNDIFLLLPGNAQVKHITYTYKAWQWASMHDTKALNSSTWHVVAINVSNFTCDFPSQVPDKKIDTIYLTVHAVRRKRRAELTHRLFMYLFIPRYVNFRFISALYVVLYVFLPLLLLFTGVYSPCSLFPVCIWV